MNNATRIERLNATLYLASTVPPDLLTQENWTMHNCQTTHCIAGWCGVSKWHNKRGYVLEDNFFPVYRPSGESDEMAFSDFHGITLTEAKEITLWNCHLHGTAAKRDVCRKLKALIRKYGGEVIYSD